MLQASKENSSFNFSYLVYLITFISLALNLILIFLFWKKNTSKTKNLKTKLSKQEQVVLEHLLEDKTNKDIAEALFLSVSTVKSHTNHIYKKLNVQSRDEVKSLFSR